MVKCCPVFPSGDGGEQYSIVTGAASIQVKNTGWDARFGGNYISGTVVTDHTMLGGPRTKNGYAENEDNLAAAELQFADYRKVIDTFAPNADIDNSSAGRGLSGIQRAHERLMSPAPATALEASFKAVVKPPSDGSDIIDAANTNPVTPLPCETLCDPANPTPYCSSLTLGGQSKNAFLTLFKLAHEQGVAISPEIWFWPFRRGESPCDRSNTTITDGVITNVGGGCLVTSTANVGNMALTTTLDVPTTLSGQITRSPDAETIDFKNPATSITLAFSDTTFQANFGGKIARLTARRDRLIWQTDKRCIAVSNSVKSAPMLYQLRRPFRLVAASVLLFVVCLNGQVAFADSLPSIELTKTQMSALLDNVSFQQEGFQFEPRKTDCSRQSRCNVTRSSTNPCCSTGTRRRGSYRRVSEKISTKLDSIWATRLPHSCKERHTFDPNSVRVNQVTPADISVTFSAYYGNYFCWSFDTLQCKASWNFQECHWGRVDGNTLFFEKTIDYKLVLHLSATQDLDCRLHQPLKQRMLTTWKKLPRL